RSDARGRTRHMNHLFRFVTPRRRRIHPTTITPGWILGSDLDHLKTHATAYGNLRVTCSACGSSAQVDRLGCADFRLTHHEACMYEITLVPPTESTALPPTPVASIGKGS